MLRFHYICTIGTFFLLLSTTGIAQVKLHERILINPRNSVSTSTQGIFIGERTVCYGNWEYWSCAQFYQCDGTHPVTIQQGAAYASLRFEQSDTSCWPGNDVGPVAIWNPADHCRIILSFDKARPNPGQLVQVWVDFGFGAGYQILYNLAGYPLFSLGADTSQAGSPAFYNGATNFFSAITSSCDTLQNPQSTTVTASIESGSQFGSLLNAVTSASGTTVNSGFGSAFT